MILWLMNEFIFSSGTSQGRPKFIPFTDELMENTLQLFRTAFAFRNRCSELVSVYVPPHISRFSLFLHPLTWTEELRVLLPPIMP